LRLRAPRSFRQRGDRGVAARRSRRDTSVGTPGMTVIDPLALAEEERRADALRRTVDVACALLRQARLPRGEAETIVAFTKKRVLELFPGKEDVLDLVPAQRFGRILDDFCAPARVLPFPRR